jgi:UDP-glucose 4-epimerase
MAIHKLITCALGEKTFEVYGGLESTRSNTFVSDAVDALITFGVASDLLGIYNIAGGEKKSLGDWIISVEKLIGKKIELKFIQARDGDQRLTSGNTLHARKAMGYVPKVESSEGLKLQLTHILKNSNLYINS